MGYWYNKDDIEVPITCDGCGAIIIDKEHIHAYGDELCGVSMILCDKCN